jgi:hypothetical protein
MFYLWKKSSVDERSTIELLPIANGKRRNGETKKEAEKAHIEIKRRLDEAKREP